MPQDAPPQDPDLVISTLNSLSSSSFPTENARQLALTAARALVHRLEAPWERMYDIAWTQPAFLACLRIAQNLNLFSHLEDNAAGEPVSAGKLAEKVGADRELLRRVLRVLVKEDVIVGVAQSQAEVNNDGGTEQEGLDDTYLPTLLSTSLSCPTGLITGLSIYYLAGIPQHSLLPTYLASTSYLNPSDGANPPWKYFENVPEFKGDRWEWYKTRPELGEMFNRFLSAVRREGVPWTELYYDSPFPERILDGWDGKSVLLVDVGGGKGEDLLTFARALSSSSPPTSTTSSSHPPATQTTPTPSLILQDLPSLLSSLPSTSPLFQPSPSSSYTITLQPHNILTPNPTRHSKLYFLHSILHDWTDDLATQILSHIRDAMKPGYSRLIIFDRVVPERASEWDRRTAALDINMMCNFAALERTEREWKRLIEGVGLRFSGRKKVVGQSDFLEAEL